MLSRPTGLPTNFHELYSGTTQPLPTGTQHLKGLHQITPYTDTSVHPTSLSQTLGSSGQGHALFHL